MWRRGDPPPRRLFDALADGCLFEAHNAFFEWCIWHNVMVPRYGWPPLRLSRVVCSAARAAVACLPRALEHAVIHAGLDVRKGDSKAMKKLSSPRKPTKKDAREWWDEDDAPELYEQLYEYCGQDVEAESALSDAIPALSAFERRLFIADFRINLRGVLVDTEFVDAALAVNQMVDREIGDELIELTRGDVMARHDLEPRVVREGDQELLASDAGGADDRDTAAGGV
jgi:DNA polymerase